MPSDEYAPIGGAGALKIKGAKVQKKKKRKEKSDLEKNLDKGRDSDALVKRDQLGDEKKDTPGSDPDYGGKEEDDDVPKTQKTESEKRYDEIKKKRLLQMAAASGSRPELLKTHKERVEELNTYLSKLSEHHDMPKIGPG